MIFQVRPLVTSDLPDLIRIDRDSYSPQLRESEEAFLSKMALFRAGSLGCFDGDEMCGYAFALPWTSDGVIGVGQVLEALPVQPAVMYLHDMVVAPARRRQGVASRLLAEIAELARRLALDRVVLVAVQGSEPVWQHLGFRVMEQFEYVPGAPASRMERAPGSEA